MESIINIISYKGFNDINFHDSQDEIRRKLSFLTYTYDLLYKREYYEEWDMVIHYNDDLEAIFFEFFNDSSINIKINNNSLINFFSQTFSKILQFLSLMDQNLIDDKNDSCVISIKLGVCINYDDDMTKSIAIFPLNYYDDYIKHLSI